MYKLHRSVIVLSFVSFFTDISSEMIYPLLPIYLVTVIGSTPAILGLIEGFAEAIASLFKYLSGIYADKIPSKKPLVVFGYSVSSLTRPLIGLATAWHTVFILRFIDRVGKGIRSSPRDAILAEVTPEEHRGRAYGFNRAMDHTGAVIGPLVATALLLIPGMTYQNVFLIAAIPGVIAVLLVTFGLADNTSVVERNSSEKEKIKINPFQDLKKFNADFKVLLFSIFLFALGNSTDAFILLKLKDSGVTAALIPAAWSAFHVVKAVSSHYLGNFSDRVGYKKMLVAGWALYFLVYLGMSVFQEKTAVVLLFIAYGIFYGMTEGPEKAWISKLAPKNLKGSAFGLYHMTIGFATLPASVIFGLIWTHHSPSAAFTFGAALAGIAIAVISIGSKKPA